MRADGGSLSFTASPVAADGHLYLTAEDGRVLVIKTGPEYELVSVNKLDDPILATPAIARGAMFFRTQSRMVAVGEMEDDTTPPRSDSREQDDDGKDN